MANKRSLPAVNHKIFKNSKILEMTLSDLLATKSSLRVLEVGFGQGRTLMELAWLFRNDNVKFYGVDLNQTPPMEKREDLRNIARSSEIIPEAALAGFELPEVFFYDATRLHFADESFDLIYSAVVIQFMERKAEFLEEVCRVLKPGGVALLRIGEANWNYPFSRICDDRILTPYTNRFVLKYGDELIPLPIYVKLFEANAFRFEFINHPRCVIRISKLRSSRLNLRLELDQKLSISMSTLPYRHSEGNVRGGIRSVYDVHPEVYRACFEQGFLSHEQLRTNIALPEEYQMQALHETA